MFTTMIRTSFVVSTLVAVASLVSVTCSEDDSPASTTNATMQGSPPPHAMDDVRGPTPSESSARFGARVFAASGCAACHPIGSIGVGPDLAGVYGSTRSLVGGREVVADEAYLRRAILDPSADITVGYTNLQPSYEGQFSEVPLRGLIDLLMCWGQPPVGLDCSGV
jgi:hypothetical protein